MLPSIDDIERTTIVPHVVPPGRLRAVMPWVGFGILAVLVVAATSVWAATLREPPRVWTVTAAAPVAAPPSDDPAPPSPAPRVTPAPVAAVVPAGPRKRVAPRVPRTSVVRAPVVATSAPAARTSAAAPTTRARVVDEYGDDLLFGSAPTARKAEPTD